MQNYKIKQYNCPLELTLDIISRKWTSTIIWYLKKETRRFNELEKLLPGITRKVLIQQLKELETYGIITRTVYAEVPPRVEYSLTKEGEELEKVYNAAAEWGYKHLRNFTPEIEDKAAE